MTPRGFRNGDPVGRIDVCVDRSDPSGCWYWTGIGASKVKGGYVRVRVGQRGVLAHRFVFETLVGPVAAGLTLDHLCRNPPCCNPDHLEPVTQAENNRRGGNSIKTHCPKGHPYDDANTYRRPDGWRDCRRCISARSRKRRVRQRTREAIL